MARGIKLSLRMIKLSATVVNVDQLRANLYVECVE